MPLDQRAAQRARHLLRQHGLAGAGLALDQQRAAQRHGGVHRHLQLARGDVALGAPEAVHAPGPPAPGILGPAGGGGKGRALPRPAAAAPCGAWRPLPPRASRPCARPSACCGPGTPRRRSGWRPPCSTWTWGTSTRRCWRASPAGWRGGRGRRRCWCAWAGPVRSTPIRCATWPGCSTPTGAAGWNRCCARRSASPLRTSGCTPCSPSACRRPGAPRRRWRRSSAGWRCARTPRRRTTSWAGSWRSSGAWRRRWGASATRWRWTAATPPAGPTSASRSPRRGTSRRRWPPAGARWSCARRIRRCG